MFELTKSSDADDAVAVSGEFLDISGERYYAIRNVDRMSPFFISVISDSDHWLFVSSTGGLTAGRVSPETALFPYITVDRIHESWPHTGSKTLVRLEAAGKNRLWEPFNREHDDRYAISRHLYKSVLGNKLRFEEINHDLRLAFRYSWTTSDQFGFVRQCELENLGEQSVNVDLLDGLQNILPAGTPRISQANASNLVDAYKWTELEASTGLAIYALYSGVSDRAEPSESLKANTVFCLGLDAKKFLLTSKHLDAFRRGRQLYTETHRRGLRGAYFVNDTLDLAPRASQHWQLVADVEQSQSRVVELQRQLGQPAKIAQALERSVEQGSDELARIMGTADGFQAAAEENVTAHHYANVLFNTLRGGIFDDQYRVSAEDFAASIRHFNKDVYQSNAELLAGLPDKIDISSLLEVAEDSGDPQLQRLCHEYLPITFGRRHGDPSRPWNDFSIKLKDGNGNRLLSYEGNWRDIFQNWEALTFSYPEFVESVVAKFVNASTMDGYNPYRITKEGIDWEIEDPRHPWSYIGYWGDHQIIYLQKLLELSRQFHPTRLAGLLRKPIFSYANVPYRIKPFEALIDDPKSTVVYDFELAAHINRRVARIGADGKLVLDADGDVYQVNLFEKLLVPLLSKLGNLVIDGGIWLNTQRPEWNDANNALVGQGLSMVTLYYMRRYVRLLQELLAEESAAFELSDEVGEWLAATALALRGVRPLLEGGPISPAERSGSLKDLGSAASRYREAIYREVPFSGKALQPLDPIRTMLDDALAAIDHSIATNQRDDGLYNAYNLLDWQADGLYVNALYPMLEGQVAALSAGAIAPAEACAIVETLFDSEIYRADQRSFMLYPDRPLPEFLDKNRVPAEEVEAIPLLTRMLRDADERILCRDAGGCYRFNADFENIDDLVERLDSVTSQYGREAEAARGPLLELYEKVFNHRAFTGRSGGMFGFEGLGCIYWHMVSKLLLAVQENFFSARDGRADERIIERLGQLYYRVREGLGFNKSPSEYGAFPADPYSHTPKHAGARQPGMTGTVKEEILSRFGELGVRVSEGAVRFQPDLLRAREFGADPGQFRFLDVDGNWQEIPVPAAGLAFTWCQVPVVYRLDNEAEPALTVVWDDGSKQTQRELTLSAELSSELFMRSGRIRKLELIFGTNLLFER